MSTLKYVKLYLIIKRKKVNRMRYIYNNIKNIECIN